MVGCTELTAHLANISFFNQEHIWSILGQNNNLVSFTTDSWTIPNVTAYLAMTGNFINKELSLVSILLGLIPIEGPHSGANIAECFMRIIKQYSHDIKIVLITTDNANVNTQMAKEIEAINPAFSSKAQAIGFMAHTIHLAAPDGINALESNGTSTSTTNNELSKAAGPMDIVSLIDPPDGIDINYNSIISQLAQLASDLNQSPQICEKLMATIKLMYDEEKPSNTVILLSHVATRWNSTYEMLV
ncbi:hypothetical protein O181_032138 [Austropuccinia psidii MF-1]|uniref:Uncharacterized protein n=1 Tax=Austropuccinia psidii MF-1 TaxID=1389203 RepID=A0A9Q3CYV7_9BASI|nr:hypothetical protein [Austropuccinia psidii MF-1]